MNHNDGWIEWNGGRCPVFPSTIVEVKYRGNLPSLANPSKAGEWNWEHRGNSGDIVAYRKYIEEPMPVTMETDSALDVQMGGNHYKKLKIQPIEYIHANGIPFAEGSAIKYLTRWRDKGGIADLEKARHFIDLLIELERGEAQAREVKA